MLEETVAKLNVLVRTKTGDAGARAYSLETLPGHAGFSYSFVLERSDGGAPAGKLVVRLAPPGVKIAGPSDIMRQARIMASLADTPVPVPHVYWYGDEPEFFGRPYFLVEFRDGFSDPFPLSDEMKRLDYLLDRPTLDPAVVARAPELRERLRSTLPATRA